MSFDFESFNFIAGFGNPVFRPVLVREWVDTDLG